MDLAFNDVKVSKEQLMNMTSEDLQRESSESLESEASKQYKIVIPSIPCEFQTWQEKKHRYIRCQFLMKTSVPP